ncbi:MAG: DUF421 domain-containing protein [Firmicutes bacterium]|nr:DUF421 domain-containing protein [Bacillota bacterium]
MQLLNVIYRTLFFYFFILISYRVMGKREIAQLGVIDLIISILIAELVAISIENSKDPMYYTVIPIVILTILEIILAFISVKSRKFKSTMDGKPTILICNGKLNYKELITQRYTIDDLLLGLRQQGIKSIEEVEYAFLEPNGKLSVFKYNIFKRKSEYPMPIILDGEIQYDTLNTIHRDINWVNKELLKLNLTYDKVFYAFCKKNKIYLIKK